MSVLDQAKDIIRDAVESKRRSELLVRAMNEARLRVFDADRYDGADVAWLYAQMEFQRVMLAFPPGPKWKRARIVEDPE